MKIATPWKMWAPLYQQPPLRVEVPSSPIFENLIEGSTTSPLLQQKGVRGAPYLSTILYCEITPLNRDVTWLKL